MLNLTLCTTRLDVAHALQQAARVVREIAPLTAAAQRPSADWIDAALRDAGADAGCRFHAYRAIRFVALGDPGPGPLLSYLARLDSEGLAKLLVHAGVAVMAGKVDA